MDTRKKILIVEDESDIRMNLVRFLEFSGYKALEAADGVAGLKIAVESAPDLILSDIMMPEMNGFQFLEELQKDEYTGSIPFLFLSAKADKFFVREGMNLGADDFITKPFDFDELISVVDKRIAKKDKREKHLTKKIEDLQTNLKRTMPHEVRTPLNIILGLSEYLIKNLDKTARNETIEMLSNIHDSGKRLLRMFENYLYYANLEVLASNPRDLGELGEFKTSLTEHIINDIISVKNRNYDRIEDFELSLEDATLKISEQYFTKIVEEIIDNCLKFSEKGDKIQINSGIQNGLFSMVFTDYGRGMTERQIKNIDAYVQFERKLYEQQGTGLGLTIIKKIAELHNGSFGIESSPGHYTIVTVSLPLAD